MKGAGLKCKPSKCEILRDSIKYLGRMVDRHGVRPDPDAVEAVLTWNKGKKFERNERAREAFENIKQEMCEAPVLGMPTEKSMYVLDNDASVVAFSEFLQQEQEKIGRVLLLPLPVAVKF